MRGRTQGKDGRRRMEGGAGMHVFRAGIYQPLLRGRGSGKTTIRILGHRERRDLFYMEGTPYIIAEIVTIGAMISIGFVLMKGGKER